MKYGEELRSFLETMSTFNVGTRPKGFIYKNLYEFVLKNGQPCKAAGSDLVMEYGRKGECFKNAFDLVERNNGLLRYVEGYAFSIAIPMLHAWAIDKDGYVYDNTWQEGKAYYGVTFPLDYVRKIILKRKSWGVLDAWDIGWPLLTGKDPYPIRG